MDFELFWDAYQRRNVLDIFDDAMEIFSKPLPPAVVSEYNVEEVILEITGHHFKAKLFDKVDQFTQLIREVHPAYYEQTRGFIFMRLIDVYCYFKQGDQVKRALLDMAQTPDQQFDEFMLCIQKALYYGYTKDVVELCQQIYESIKASRKLIKGSEEDLAIYHIYHHLQGVFEAAKGQGKSVNWEEIATELAPYEFNQETEFLSLVQRGLFPDDERRLRDQVPTLFRRDPESALIVLQMCFLRYMLKRGFPFALSIEIWGSLMAHLQKQRQSKRLQSLGSFFELELKPFRVYLSKKRGLVLDLRFKVALTLWGGYYLYDFLYQNELINHPSYQEAVGIVKSESKRFMKKNQGRYWAYDFVHRWGDSPDSVESEAWQREEDQFRSDLYVI